MYFEPVDLGPMSNPSQALIHGLTGNTQLGVGYAIHRVHYGEDGAQPTLVRTRGTTIHDQCFSGDLVGWAWSELSEGPTDYEINVILGLHPELHDAHVWDWMDAGIQELIDAPMAQVLTRLDAVANAWRKASPSPTWSELVDQYMAAGPDVDFVAEYRAHHLCQPFALPASDIPF